MTTLGPGLLLATALLAALAASAWVHGAVTGSRRSASIAAATGHASTAAAVLATALLTIALIVDDRSIDYVVKVTEADMPMYYRVTSLWSAMEGSLLLWLLTLVVVATLFAATSRRQLPQRDAAIAAAVLAMIVAAFAVVAFVAAPFTAGGSPGPAPSPLLQDHPAMGVHPPLLYAGFAGLAVPFALSCAAAAQRAAGAQWVRSTHRWTLAAWLPLTAGIALGAWWSYAVLGWGGYWAWDPVENASLLPWLVSTALLHATGPRARRASWRRWAVVLAGLAFLLVLLATFLTRSGAVQSIHAFSTSPLGPLLLGILLVASAAWLVLVARPRALPALQTAEPLRSPASALQANRILLAAIAAIVLLGSTVPGLLAAFGGPQIAVGPPWYARTLGPIAIVLLATLAATPWMRRTRRAGETLLIGVPAALVVGVAGFLAGDIVLAITAGLAAAIALAPLAGLARPRRERQRLGASLAHLGVAVGAFAIVAGGHGAVVEQTVPIGGSVSAGSATATLVGLDRFRSANRDVAEARILLTEDDRVIGEAAPQLRWYEQHGTVLAGPSIRSEPLRDVYLTLLDVDAAEGGATVRLAVTPLASWLWAAGGLMLLGGAVSALPRSATARTAPVRERAANR